MTLATQLESVFTALENEGIAPSLTDIPMVGDDLSSLVNELTFTDIRAQIDAAIAAAEAIADPAARATALADAINALSLTGVSALASGTEVTVGFQRDAMATVDIADGAVDLGGSAFSLDARAAFTGDVSVSVDLGIVYDAATDTVALEVDAADELTFAASISADVAAAASLANGFITADLVDALATPELAVTAGFNFDSLSPSDITATYGGAAQMLVDLETTVADNLLPGVVARLAVTWDPFAASASPTIEFSDVGIKLGGLIEAIDELLSPVTDILFEGIIGKIVNIMTAPVPIIHPGLSAVGILDAFDRIPQGGDGIFNLLDGIGIYLEATGNTEALEILSAFAEALAVLKQLKDLADTGGTLYLGDINVPGSPGGGGEAAPIPEFTVAEIDGKSPIEMLEEIATTGDLFKQVIEAIPGISSGGEVNLSDTSLQDDSGLSFPLFENPERIIDVILPELSGGGPVPIIEYDIPALTAEARFGEYFFRIFGPFGLTIDGFAAATVDFKIGYDTYALTVDGGTFLDGLYLTTAEMQPGEKIERQPEDLQFEYRPIAYATSGIFAGVAVDAVVLRVGVKGGITGFVAAFLPGGEVDTDMGEVPNGVLRLQDFGSGCFVDPILGRIAAEVIATIKVGFGPFSFSYGITIADITLANFEFGCPPATEEIEGLASVVSDDLLLHVGPAAHLRVINEIVGTDDAEVYRISVGQDDDDADVAGSIKVEYRGTFQQFGVEGDAAPDVITAAFQDQDDALVISADMQKSVTASGGGGNDILEGAALNDRLSGDQGNDRLFGRAGDDELRGGSGDDYLEGGLGADLLDGGADRDQVSYESSATGVSFAWTGSQLLGSGGEAQGDRLLSIEYIIGSGFNDMLVANPLAASTLQGNAGDDVLIGGTRDDFLMGDAGADALIGGGGENSTSYVTSTGAVQVDLASGVGTGGDAQGDTYSDIDNVMGTAFYDQLKGTGGANTLGGWIGEDVIDGRGGADDIRGGRDDDQIMGYGDGARLLDGGAGIDLLDYGNAGGGVRVNLLEGTAKRLSASIFAPSDSIGFYQVENDQGELEDTTRSSFENLDGSGFDDILIGDNSANTIQGMGGDDTVQGLGGNDLLRGGLGADALDGGAGTDWADYTDGFGVAVTLADGFAGIGSTAEGDTLTNIENLRGSDGTDVLVGDDGNNVIAPELALDTVDIVVGQGGVDTLLVDYSRQDWGRGVTGGLATGRLERLSFDGTILLDGVQFATMEQLHLTGTLRDDNVTGGALADRLFLGGGDDTADAGSGTDVVLMQEGNDRTLYASTADTELFWLNGGRGFDGVELSLGSLVENLTIRAGDGITVNAILQNGAVVEQYEALELVRTGSGTDLIEQTGAVDNRFYGGGNADLFRPGLGIDYVNGGSDVVTDALRFNVGDAPYYALTSASQAEPFLTPRGDILEVDYSDTGSAVTTDMPTLGLSSYAALTGATASVVLINYTHAGAIRTADGQNEVSFYGIEHVDIRGSALGDTLIGTWNGVDVAIVSESSTLSQAPRLAAPTPKGDDTLRGLDGADTLIGLTGNDSLFGGRGADRLVGTDVDAALGQSGASFDRYEIDQLTGGRGGDRFVLGVARPTDTGPDEPVVLYTGRLPGDDDDLDNRAIITDFNAAQGDRLVMAGRASMYTVESADGGVNILLNGDTREIIAHLAGVESLTLNSQTVEWVAPTTPSFLPPGGGLVPILPIDLGGVQPVLAGDLPTLPSFATQGRFLANPASMAVSYEITAPTPGRTIDLSPGFTLPTALELRELIGVQAPVLNPSLGDLVTPTKPSSWVTQQNLPTELRATLFETADGSELDSGLLTLEGDARGFGTFDGDPFGLGQGIVLSTGQVTDLDGTNQIDGGLYGPYAPNVTFETIGSFGGSTIYRADISFLGTALNSLTLTDDGDGIGGGTGLFSGTELDALVLSRQRVTADDLTGGLDLNDTAAFQRLDVFNYATAYSDFRPGSMRSGNMNNGNFQGTNNGLVDIGYARLGQFDYSGSLGGSFTLGDGGSVGFDLTETVTTDGPLYIYVAEGGASEGLAASVAVSDARLAAPADLSTDFGAQGAADDLIRLTYDFTLSKSAGKLLTFDYVLATEELREFAGTEFNDTYRVFLNGVQMATLSDGTAATINQLQPAPFAASHPDLVMNPVGTGPAAADTRADAYTKPLSFVGQTRAGANQLVIEVEDVGDGLMDSAILIKAGSLGFIDDGRGSDGTVVGTPRIQLRTQDITVTEGAPGVEVTIALTGVTALTADLVLTLTPNGPDIDLGSGAGAAHQLSFAAGGALAATLTVSAPLDDIVEPTEFALAAITAQGGGVFDGMAVAPMVVQVLDATAPESFQINLGDAPDRFSRLAPTAWSDAWTDKDVAITMAQAGVTFVPVNLGLSNPGTFGGSSLSAGDLGVSGRSGPGSAGRPQDIDGTDVLRFDLVDGHRGTGFQIDLANFDTNVAGSGLHDSARVSLWDNGVLVDSFVFDASGGVSLAVSDTDQFDQLTVESGGRVGAGDFSSGTLSDGATSAGDATSAFSVEALMLSGIIDQNI